MGIIIYLFLCDGLGEQERSKEVAWLGIVHDMSTKYSARAP